MKHDGIINISTCENRKSTTYKNEKLLWSEFVQKISKTTYTKESIDEYFAMDKGKQDNIKDVGGFVGGSLIDGKRRKKNVKSRSLITLDADYAYTGMEGIVDLLYGYACCVYSTHKHITEKPRLRFTIPLSREVDTCEYEAIARLIASDMGIEYFDDTTYEPERLMYYPSTSKDGQFIKTICDGKWLDADKVLNRYIDYKDVSKWPVSRRCSKKIINDCEKQENPREKDGMIGAFCRAYDIHEVIEKFLNDTYTKCDESDRYTFTKGSSSCGLVIYNNGDFAYSHHSTDPCCSRLCNSFDLLRIHRFLKEDEEKSFNEMIEFCSKDEKVVYEYGRNKIRKAQNDFSNIDEYEIDINEDDDSWLGQLEVDKKGYYKPSVKNLYTILDNDINLKNCVRFDEFCNSVMKSNKLPWIKCEPKNNKKINEDYLIWDDYDDALLRCYLEKNYGIYAPVKTDDALSAVAKNYSYHPIRDYINSLKWDGVKRLDNLLIDYLGAEDCDYTKAVIRKTMVAAVSRVFEPGIKFDYMPVLVGPQGVGKSHILSLIGRKWYSDSFNTVLGKEAYEQLQGCWIIEMAELSAIRKVEAEAVKHFISKRDDVYRQAYGRRVIKHPRQCVFFGTTNDIEFLKDKTGNRRYWPVVVAKNKASKNMWKEFDDYEIDQVWAEAKNIYDEGELLLLDKGLDIEAIKKQEVHMEDNTKEGMIIEYLDKLLPDNWNEMDIGGRRRYISGGDFSDAAGVKKRERVCAMEIWCELFGGDPRNMNAAHSREINDILRNIDHWSEHQSSSGKLRFGLYGTQKAFVRNS
ncbi:virulence-associated E family protein [Clostridium sp.]|uniref:virulence-associated E family protein n=1 Tax=Clostridium sp. TaxID=1506 RepID=UPI002FC7C634